MSEEFYVQVGTRDSDEVAGTTISGFDITDEMSEEDIGRMVLVIVNLRRRQTDPNA
jgi:hypothetical protein